MPQVLLFAPVLLQAPVTLCFREPVLVGPCPALTLPCIRMGRRDFPWPRVRLLLEACRGLLAPSFPGGCRSERSHRGNLLSLWHRGPSWEAAVAAQLASPEAAGGQSGSVSRPPEARHQPPQQGPAGAAVPGSVLRLLLTPAVPTGSRQQGLPQFSPSRRFGDNTSHRRHLELGRGLCVSPDAPSKSL